MNTKRKIEVFSAGCPSCEIIVLDMNNKAVATRAKKLGVRSVPAVAVNGELAGCCAGREPDSGALRNAGIGSPL